MNTQTLQTTLDEMKARSLSGELSSSDKLFIKEHFERITFREFTVRNCSRCYADAFIEMYITFKKYGLRAMPNFKLKRGIVFRSANFPEVVTNSNLTDELAIKWLQDNPKRASFFEIIPDNWELIVSENANTTETDNNDNNHTPESAEKPKKVATKKKLIQKDETADEDTKNN